MSSKYKPGNTAAYRSQSEITIGTKYSPEVRAKSIAHSGSFEGTIENGRKEHKWELKFFKTPTWCKLCSKFIWYAKKSTTIRNSNSNVGVLFQNKVIRVKVDASKYNSYDQIANLQLTKNV